MRILIYRVSSETLTIIHRKIFGTKLSGKVLYHFAIFALGIILLKVISDNKLIINELISIN